jgi:hypothetical protein
MQLINCWQMFAEAGAQQLAPEADTGIWQASLGRRVEGSNPGCCKGSSSADGQLRRCLAQFNCRSSGLVSCAQCRWQRDKAQLNRPGLLLLDSMCCAQT